MIRGDVTLMPLLGLGVVAAGTGLIWTSGMPAPRLEVDSGVDVRTPRHTDFDVRSVVPSTEPVRFRYAAGPDRSVVLRVTHVGRGPSGEVRSSLHLRTRERHVRRSGGDHSHLTRRYRCERADVYVADNSGTFAGDATAAIGRSLIESSLVHRTDTVGQSRSIGSLSPANDRIEPLVALLEGALDLLSPHFRSDAVLTGDVWTYRLPLPDAGSAPAFESGDLRMRYEFEGWLSEDERRIAVLRQMIDVSARGRWRSTSFEIRGHGRGRALFAVGAGRLEASWLEIRHRWDVGGRFVDDGRYDTRLYMGDLNDEQRAR